MCINIVDVFTESDSNSRVDSLFILDQVNIPVVSKTKAKINTSINQQNRKEIVCILSDIVVPVNRCMAVLGN